MKHSPPNRREWFTLFWKTGFAKTKGSAQPTLLQINIDRYTTSTRSTNIGSESQLNIFVIPEGIIISIGGWVGIIPICTAVGALQFCVIMCQTYNEKESA